MGSNQADDDKNPQHFVLQRVSKAVCPMWKILFKIPSKYEQRYFVKKNSFPSPVPPYLRPDDFWQDSQGFMVLPLSILFHHLSPWSYIGYQIRYEQ
jgi:hypothetical protein